MKSYEGVIILGAHRSGTTMLRRLLDGHSQICCPPETNVFAGMGRFMREDRFNDGTLGVVSGLAFAGLPPDETIPMLREFAFGLHRAVAKKQSKPIWASKTALDSLYVDQIEALCGDASRFVCITRHGADVACSVLELCVKQEAFLPELHDYVRACPFPLEAFGKMWVDVTRRLQRFAKDHPDNTLSIRYEDLVADPRATMDALFRFVGVEPEPVVDTALKRTENVGPGDFKAYGRPTVDASSVGRWKKLPALTRSRLGAVMNETLVSAGYEAMPVVPEPSAEEMRRRYQMGLLLQSMKRPE
ncbi:MAG TPA: sulfotransferase [Minicystis sp.]|nr:sulfotransferase [Minicystis sp.]